jgi:hypothetical protein
MIFGSSPQRSSSERTSASERWPGNLGHSDLSLTLRVYSHVIEERDRAAADIIGRVLPAPAKPKKLMKACAHRARGHHSAASSVEHLAFKQPTEEAFFAAGRRVVDLGALALRRSTQLAAQRRDLGPVPRAR